MTALESGKRILTFVVAGDEQKKDDQRGFGVILDESFNVMQKVYIRSGARKTNMHEFTVLKGAATALTLTGYPRFFHSDQPKFSGWILDVAIVEVDIATGRSVFEWWASDSIHPYESYLRRPEHTSSSSPWDCYHLNSVDKDDEGNYYFSARHTSTIYKISRADISIIWRLGGKNNSFVQKNFNFSFQHDARIHPPRGKEDATITMFNNDALGNSDFHNAEYSTAITVALETSRQTMTATLKHTISRPDGMLTGQRGNFQSLQNNNSFVCWSDNGYISEFTAEGALIYSAHFQTHRFATYRAYKFEFVSHPRDPPDLKCSVYGVSRSSAVTVCYVSWNGATEIRSWNLWGLTNETNPLQGHRELLDTRERKGFETVFMIQGHIPYVLAEAIDNNQRPLRESRIVSAEPPEGAEPWNDWEHSGELKHAEEQKSHRSNLTSQTTIGDRGARFDAVRRFSTSHPSPHIMYFAMLAFFAGLALGRFRR